MNLFQFIAAPVIAFLNQERKPRKFPLSDYERISYELKPCDVILVEGRTKVSDVIGWITLSPWTHAALYIGRIHDIEDPELQKIIRHHYRGDDSDKLIVESLLGKGTIIRHLKVYEHDHLRICRPSRLNVRDSHQIIRFALSRLGVEYDIRQILDLARLMFPWSVLPRKWRSSLFNYRAGKPTRTVCSTMIAEAFAFVQFPILPLVKRSANGNGQYQLFRRNPKLATPSDFDYSPYFEIIKYPFIDFSHSKDYHLLPWHGDEELIGEENDFYIESSFEPTEQDVEEALDEVLKRAAEGETSGAEDINLSGKVIDEAAGKEQKNRG